MQVISHYFLAITCACLPIAAYEVSFWVFSLHGERWREAAIAAATCWGVYLAVITESLSLFRLINRPVLAFAWFVPTAVVFAYGWRSHGKVILAQPSSDGEASLRLRDIESLDRLLLLWVGLIVALVGATAILAPPNTWDAMAYHMSRVAQWMINRDVRPYPAFYSPQLFLSPWAEYAILHLDLLYDSDRLANIVNWLSMGGTVLGVSLIAERLGAGVRGQIFAAVGCATLPAGVLEASGAMNTYASAFWVVVASYYALRWNQEQDWNSILGLGAGVSLAVMTKGTNYTFLPFVLIACWWLGASRARLLLLKRLPVILLLILILNGPLYVRNYRLSGSPLGFTAPLGNDTQRQYANSHVSISIAFANVIKNLALHFGSPIDSLNIRGAKSIHAGLQFLGVDPNDPASTYRGGFHLNPVSTYESIAGNPLQLALIVFSFLLLVNKRQSDHNLRIFAAGVCASFVLFCALIRWQAWNGRYHLPLFALALAVVGKVSERIHPKFISTWIAILLLASAMPFAMMNSLRTIAPWKRTSILYRARTAMYFSDYHQTLESSYLAAAKAALRTGCRKIGVDAALEDFDYPVFAFLGAGHNDLQIFYTGVPNLTAPYGRPGTEAPCLVICLRCTNSPAKWAQYRNVGGRVTLFDEIALFHAKGNLVNKQTFDPPANTEIPELLQQIDLYRDRLRASGLGSLDEKVMRAARDWPAKQVELSGKIDFLFGETYAGWRVRDSAYPLRREGHGEVPAQFDPLQVKAAAEVLQNWNQTMPNKIRGLNDLVDQLYTSWRVELAATQLPESSGPYPCRLSISSIHKPAGVASSESPRSQLTELADCSCISAKSAGTLLASKPFGEFDVQAENLTTCRLFTSARGEIELQAPKDIRVDERRD
jgi:hypothetical protein